MTDLGLTGDDEFPDSYEVALKHAQFEDDMYIAENPGKNPNDVEGEWVIVEDSKQKLVGPFFTDHSGLLGMIDNLVGKGIPRATITIEHGTRAKWKLEGAE